MKKNKPIVFFIPAVLLIVMIGCGQGHSGHNPSVKNDSVVKSDDGFSVAYTKFSESVKQKSYSGILSITDTSIGIFILESPGALPVIFNYSDAEEYVAQNGKTFFDLFNDKISLEPATEEMPIVDCEYTNGSPYNKSGCFKNDISSEKEGELNFISACSGNNTVKQKAEEARKNISMKVINTYNHVYYFTNSGKNWYLTFLDLRTPCES